MKKGIYLVLVVFLVSGCATVRTAQGPRKDWVTKKEARAIAKKCLYELEDKKDFWVYSRKVLDNKYTYHHQDYWFVSFKKKNYLFNKTKFLVVIDKRNGDVVYSEKQYPSTVKGLWWIFHLDEKEYPCEKGVKYSCLKK